MLPILAAMGVTLAAGSASAQSQAQDGEAPRSAAGVLFDASLRATPAHLLAIEGGKVVYLDGRGARRAEPLSSWLGFLALPPGPPEGEVPAGPARIEDGVLPAEMPAADTSLGWMELVDGQRFPGRPGGDPPDGSFRWLDPVMADIGVAVEQLATLTIDPRAGEWPAGGGNAAEDTAVLSNGDRLAGFADALTARGVTFEIGGQARELAWGRLAAVAFSNPRVPPAGIVLWRRDGGVAKIDELLPARTSDGATEEAYAARLAVRPDPRAPLGADEVFAVLFDAQRLTPLASLAPPSQRPLGGRRWSAPVAWSDRRLCVFGAADLTMPGPIEARWEVPAGPARLSALAELPEAMWTWGDCEVVVSVEPGGEVFRGRLCAETPRALVNVGLPEAGRARALSIRVEPGVYGAVQDRVVIRRPVLVR